MSHAISESSRDNIIGGFSTGGKRAARRPCSNPALATTVIPLSEKDLAFWRNEIKQARQMRQDVADLYGWDENLKRYVPKPVKNASGQLNADVNIGADFRDVERKKAALFFDTPEVGLTVKQDRAVPWPEGQPAPPKPLMPGSGDGVSAPVGLPPIAPGSKRSMMSARPITPDSGSPAAIDFAKAMRSGSSP